MFSRERLSADDWKKQKLSLDLEREVQYMVKLMQKIRESSHLSREPSDSLCLNLKEEICLTETRAQELSTSLDSLLRLNQNVKSKLADERAFFETLTEFPDLPQQAKDLVCRSYFEQTVIDFKRRLREYRALMEQIISMYAANSSKPETVGGIIEILEKHQESLKAAAAKVYVLHAKVEQLVHNFELLSSGQHHRVRFNKPPVLADSAQNTLDGLPPLEPPKRSFGDFNPRGRDRFASSANSIFDARSSTFSRFGSHYDQR